MVNLQALVDWLDALVDDERVSADGLQLDAHADVYPVWWDDHGQQHTEYEGVSDLTLTLHLHATPGMRGEPFHWPDFAPLFEAEPKPQSPEPSITMPIHIHVTGNTFVGSDPEAAQRIGEEAARVIQERIRRSGT